jgi:uncharacterized membrane protein YeaQ/YmgE (transglycosylase-associated protein family)
VLDHAGFFLRSLTMIMGVLGWIVMGLIAGYISSSLVNKHGEGLSLDIVLGIVGAVFGGWIFNAFGAAGVTGFNVWSLLVAVIGAMILLVLWHSIRRSPWRA